MTFLFVVKKAFRIAGERPAPHSIPRSGERVRNVDCYSARIHSPSRPDWALLFDSVTADGIIGRRWDNVREEFIEHERLSWADMEPCTFKFYHFYREFTFEFDSAARFVAWQILGLYYLPFFQSKLQTALYNRKRLVRQERIDVLKNVVRDRIDRGDGSITLLEYMSRQYGMQWIMHPDKDAARRHFDLIFGSLVDSKDLTKDGVQYNLTGGAMRTLASHDETERKHRDAIAPQRWIKWLTIVLTLTAIAQTTATFWQWRVEKAIPWLAQPHPPSASRITATRVPVEPHPRKVPLAAPRAADAPTQTPP